MIRRIILMVVRLSVILLLVALVFLLVSVLPLKPDRNEDARLGYTFSIKAAQALNLDWRETYRAALADLKPDVVRLSAYWDLIEPQQGVYDWAALDEQLAMLEGTDTRVILAVGHKLPRWPECHIPEWARQLNEQQARQAVLIMVQAVVERYKGNGRIESWQVENESLFRFGDCPSWSNDRSFLKQELTLVRSLDTVRQLSTSESGELGFWSATATLPLDTLGVSLYRAVYNNGYHYWPLNPWFYRARMWLWSHLAVDHIFISELQMEPWGPKPVQELSMEEIYKSFSPLDVADRIDFARRTGADTILAWGVEWWYYMRKSNSQPEYWQKATEVFIR